MSVPAPAGASFRRLAAVVLALGLAMGYLEAVVVVYLRAALEVLPGAIPAQDPGTLGTFEMVEMARELATLVVIGAVGWLAGRGHLERLAWGAVVFGTWDIAYYAGLRVVIEWPPALDTWDLLFLVPSPWVGPVWAPIVVSGALIGFGLTAARRSRGGRTIAMGAPHALAALAGGGLVIASFLVDAERVLAGDMAPWSGWPLFAAGMTLAAAAAVAALRDPGTRGGRRA